MLVANRKFLMLILPFLLALFALVGCGEIEEDNNSPVIGAIPNQTLDGGATLEVDVRVTDADSDDIN